MKTIANTKQHAAITEHHLYMHCQEDSILLYADGDYLPYLTIALTRQQLRSSRRRND